MDVPFPKLLTYCPMTITLKSTEISFLHQRTNYSLYFPLSFKKNPELYSLFKTFHRSQVISLNLKNNLCPTPPYTSLTLIQCLCDSGQHLHIQVQPCVKESSNDRKDRLLQWMSFIRTSLYPIYSCYMFVNPIFKDYIYFKVFVSQ